MSTLAFDTNLANADLIPTEGGPPHSLFSEWRKKDPVHWNPPSDTYGTDLAGASIDKGFWVLTRYQDVYEVSRNQNLFSSHEGGPIIWDLEPEQLGMQRAGMMGMQPAQHTAVKRLVMPPFSPKELASFAPDIEKVAEEIVDDVLPKGQCEFVFDVASKLPVYTFCKVLGVPDDMRDTVYRLGNATADIENYSPDREESPALLLFAIAEELSEQKRQTPDNSMLSRIVNGEKLDPLNVNMFFVTLSIAGHETTRGTATHFMRLMLEHPDQYELLRSDLEKYLPNAIDEVLRFSPPVVKFRRTVMEDTEIGGQAVKKGDKVYLSYPAANRDPDIFEDPDRFDITRQNANKHLAFGTGPHVCLGARLAHMQLQALLKQVVTRMPDFEMAGDMQWMRSIWFNAIMKMPLRYPAD